VKFILESKIILWAN